MLKEFFSCFSFCFMFVETFRRKQIMQDCVFLLFFETILNKKQAEKEFLCYVNKYFHMSNVFPGIFPMIELDWRESSCFWCEAMNKLDIEPSSFIMNSRKFASLSLKKLSKNGEWIQMISQRTFVGWEMRTLRGRARFLYDEIHHDFYDKYLLYILTALCWRCLWESNEKCRNIKACMLSHNVSVGILWAEIKINLKMFWINISRVLWVRETLINT